MLPFPEKSRSSEAGYISYLWFRIPHTRTNRSVRNHDGDILKLRRKSHEVIRQPKQNDVIYVIKRILDHFVSVLLAVIEGL